MCVWKGGGRTGPVELQAPPESRLEWQAGWLLESRSSELTAERLELGEGVPG